MLRHFNGELHHKIGMGVAGGLALLVVGWIGSGGARLWSASSTALPSPGDGVVSGVFVAGAACAAVVSWRRHAGPMTGWIVATGALVATQALLVTLLALRNQLPRSAADIGVLLAVAVLGLLAVVGPLLRLHRAKHVLDDGFGIGLGMGLTAAGHLLLQLPMATPPATLMPAVIGVLVATHVAATALVLRQRALSRPMSWLLAVTVPVVALGLLTHTAVLGDATWAVGVSVARAGVGAAWFSILLISIRRSLEDDRRRINTLQQVLDSASRDQRERMHELRSTVAGLVSGSALLDSPEVSSETRERLWFSVRRELDRMERLLSGQDVSATDIDLDEELGLILDLQRLKGRRVELRSSGDKVHARFDALAEVVNILMDNAVTHGGSDGSLVEVVRRDEETVDITVTDFGRGIPADQRPQIFEWGRRGSDSPGEGIGLHLAQRLMAEDGGSLRLAEDRGVGSSFVISLPAVRRSPEDALTLEDGRGWRRSG
ncbi:HAMP domain-containing sensor histidine kinase [Nocardioides sp.]|uniref:sensor histidine kinase n=1 Tax=Nocardioides sp. TaxID=35761 RepID=UPI00262E1423|nr:HAMP domain-containing sensor histidine kinase [Nocardioides sp.]MCW2739235.1 Histidine kinase, gyrase and HSP90-like ATPase [Nocardioides sp.]